MRIEHIDIAKGIGICLVVIGHTAGLSAGLHDFIYLFHMPLFFIISGYLYHGTHNDYKSYIKKKAKRLLTPFLFFFILPAVVLFVKTNELEVFYSWIKDETFFVSPIWFLYVMFFTTIIYPLFQKLTIWTILSCTIWFLSTHFHFYAFIDTIILSLMFFAIGNSIRAIRIQYNWSYIIVCIFILIFTVAVCRPLINYRSFHFENIGFIGIIGTALMGGYAVVGISKKIENIRLLNQILTWLGENTMLIICTHLPLMFVISKFCSRFDYPIFLETIIIWICLIVFYIVFIPFSNRYLYFILGQPKK